MREIRTFELIVILLCIGSMNSGAQPFAGPRTLALGGTGCAGDRGVDAPNAERNPALARAGEASASWTPSPLGLAELTRFGASAGATAGPFDAAIILGAFGRGKYSSTSGAIAAAVDVDSSVRAGAALRITTASIERYGSAAAVCADVGASVRFAPALSFGIAVSGLGPKPPSIVASPVVLRAGLRAAPDSAIGIAADIERDGVGPVDAALGVSWKPVAALVVRAGAGLNPGRLSGGFLIAISDVGAEYALSFAPALGIEHAFGVRWRY
jgi:hypothetical protein